MDNHQDELDFEAIMREFHDPSKDLPKEEAEEPTQTAPAEEPADTLAPQTSDYAAETAPELPQDAPEASEAAPEASEAAPEAPEAAEAESEMPEAVTEIPEAVTEAAAEEPEIAEPTPEVTEPAPESAEAVTEAAEPAAEPEAAEAAAEPEAGDVPDDATVRIDDLSAVTPESVPQPTDDQTLVSDTEAAAGMEELKVDAPPSAEEPAPAPMTMKERLQELKRKLIEGPEKRYYELSEIGLGKLQIAIFVNLAVVVLCGAGAAAYALGAIPENRMRFLAFTQVLAMLVSALFGSNQLIDGLGEIFHGRFTLNTLLALTFAACCADAVLCLRELRIPCCAAFSLEMTMALWGRYERRYTEMNQMDTMRKASQMGSIVRSPDYYNKKAAFLRGEGDPDDFLDTYSLPTAPERVQSIYAFISFIASLGIATVAGLLHGTSLAVQVLSTSLLVAAPASFFVALTRPAALLERRLHMVGSVLCGWQGVRKLCGKAVLPIKDEDLFPSKTTKLNGVKFYGSRDPNEIVSLTTSLITAAGGGLVDVFHTLLSARGCTERPVEEFRDYGSGGIGGIIDGETVLLGTLEFMQDMDIEVPKGTTVSQAVYAAIGGELSAVVAIAYAKMRSSAAGLVSLTGCRRLTPILLTRDFMLTEPFLRGKFSVSTRRMVFPSQEVRDELLAVKADPEADVLALTTRDDLASYVYAITGASALRTASNLGVLIHLLGGVLGLLIMAALAYLGSTDLLTPINILLYQLIWLIPGLLVTEWTRSV